MKKYDRSEYLSEIQTAVARLTSQEFDGKLTHKSVNGQSLPSRNKIAEFVEIARSVIFPGYFGKSSLNPCTLNYHLGVSLEKIYQILWEQIYACMCFESCEKSQPLEDMCDKAMSISAAFIKSLPDIKLDLRTDVEAIYNGDPAAKNFGEIILAYPGLRAIVNYRIAHKLLDLGVSMLLARIITEQAHSETGIDIHPGAVIGRYFAIDHGTGVVIGETCILGNHVKLYQGVTLGAKSFPTDENNNPIKGIARHPILKDNVIVYANATILGRITIGENAVIGGNTWVTEDVPDGSSVFNH